MAIAWSRISSKVIAHPPDAEVACSRRCGNGKSRSGHLYRRWVTKESRKPGRALRRWATGRAAGAGDPRAASLPPTRHALAQSLRRPPRATVRAWLSASDHDPLQKGENLYRVTVDMRQHCTDGSFRFCRWRAHTEAFSKDSGPEALSTHGPSVALHVFSAILPHIASELS